MGHKPSYAFTTAAMAAALEDTPVSYEDLAEIEKGFDDVETEIIRQQVTLTTPLYARRQKTVSQIPNFWPLVLEQAPPDIDQYIQPSDSALLLSSLVSLDVRHFELDDTPSGRSGDADLGGSIVGGAGGAAPGGDPRSVSITFTFAPNDYFTDTTLSKKFWYRRARDGWSGLVSEPVPINWRRGKDLTGGLLELVCRAWEAEQAALSSSSSAAEAGSKSGSKEGRKAARESPEHVALAKKIEQTGMGGLSFFAWFGFIGRRISARESEEAMRRERERREGRKKGIDVGAAVVAGRGGGGVGNDKHDEEEEQDEDEEVDLSLEIFADGDDLAVAITEDLWPGAIKYFIQAQEQDALSDADFESDEGEGEGEEGEEEDDDDGDDGEGEAEGERDGPRPTKKRRALS